MKRLFVGNLSYATSVDELRTLFTRFGTLRSVDIVTDRETGQSRGFGFAEFTTDQAAADCVTSLHKSNFGGRPLIVQEAVQKPRTRKEFSQPPPDPEVHRRPQRRDHRRDRPSRDYND